MLNDTLLNRVLNNIKQNAGNREVVMYGLWEELQKALSDNGYNVKKIFSGNIIMQQENNCIDFNEMKKHSDKYYVVLPFFLPDKGYKQKQIMQDFGYAPINDYIFYPNDPFIIRNLNGRVSDDFGNVICGNNKNIAVNIYGTNNNVLLNDNIEIRGKLNIEINGDNNDIYIGEHSIFYGTNTLTIKTGSKINIQNNCIFTDSTLVCYDNSEIFIDKYSTFGQNNLFIAYAKSKLKIGSDCMFSLNIVIQTGDGHPIFNVENGQIINKLSDDPDGLDGYVELGSHIWVGRYAMILGGRKRTKVGDGCVIGAKAFVKGAFPNNCSLAGVPAKVVRKNIAWSRSNHIADCMNYSHLTEDEMTD